MTSHEILVTCKYNFPLLISVNNGFLISSGVIELCFFKIPTYFLDLGISATDLYYSGPGTIGSQSLVPK